MSENKESSTIKAGANTYFLDIKQTKDGKPYLLITESRFKGDGKERERRTIIVFQDRAEEFSRAISEMCARLG